LIYPEVTRGLFKARRGYIGALLIVADGR